MADVRWEMPARFAAIYSPGWMRNGGTSTDRSLSVCSSFYAEFLNLDARANPPPPIRVPGTDSGMMFCLALSRCTPVPTWADRTAELPQQRTSTDSPPPADRVIPRLTQKPLVQDHV